MPLIWLRAALSAHLACGTGIDHTSLLENESNTSGRQSAEMAAADFCALTLTVRAIHCELAMEVSLPHRRSVAFSPFLPDHEARTKAVTEMKL